MPDLASPAVWAGFIAAFLGGLARGFSGFGGAMIFVPVAASAFGPALAAPALLMFDAVLSLPMIPRAVAVANRRDVLLMTLGALVGTPIGTFLLANGDPMTLRWVIFAIVVALFVILVSGRRYDGPKRPGATVATGVFASTLGGISQMSGPPVVAYWSGTEPDVARVRANIIAYFGLATLIALATYAVGGLFTREAAMLALTLGPVYGVGLLIGARLFGLASQRSFRMVTLGLIAIAAVSSLPLLDPLFRR